jgi:sirohydrochlorin cobaltochelatase
VAACVRAARPGLPVRLAYLEFMSPSLPQAGAELAGAGCTRIELVPLFLGAGGHVRKDLPLLIAQLQQAWPGLQVNLAPAVGEVDSVVQAMAEAALARLPTSPAATAEPFSTGTP